MHLRSLHVNAIRGKVEGSLGAARGQTERRALLVRIVDDAGCAGQGEASPLPGYSPDTVADCARELATVDVARLPLPDDRPTPEWIDRALSTAALWAPAARFALETALLDWWGRHRGISVARLLAAPAAGIRTVPLSALVADITRAQEAYRRGIRTFKLKISPTTFDSDLRFLQALRDAFGTAVKVRCDANGTLPAESASRYLTALAPFEPEFVEEAVPPQFLPKLRDSPVSLAADESLADPSSWPAVASMCQVVVLKPTLLGGLAECLRRARAATARGLQLTVTHTFDGPVALAAAAELAAALPEPPLACGLDLHGGLAAWPVTSVRQIRAAHATSAGEPGLGLPDIAPE
jgi:o-succinylbenzoate synthase